jgi:hypothetical protein
MKTYLNRDERSQFVMLCCLAGYLDENFIKGDKSWAKRGSLTKEEQTKLEGATATIYEVMEKIVFRLDKVVSEQVVRDSKATEVFCLPKEKAWAKRQDYKESGYGDHIEVSRSAIDELAFKALEFCNPCNCEDESTCELKRIFEELELDPCDPENPRCVFQFRKKRKYKKREVIKDEASH